MGTLTIINYSMSKWKWQWYRYCIILCVTRPAPFNTCVQIESKPELLITPESLLLYPGGRVDILHGMYDDIQSQFKPPELNDDDVTDVDVEKVYYKIHYLSEH